MSENKQRSKNTPEECAVIAKAWAEGKTIQLWLITEQQWMDRPIGSENLVPSFGDVSYRVKPEPRTFEFWLSPKGGILGHVNEVSEKNYIEAGWTKINVKEIVD